jgi:hypothetical protein
MVPPLDDVPLPPAHLAPVVAAALQALWERNLTWGPHGRTSSGDPQRLEEARFPRCSATRLRLAGASGTAFGTGRLCSRSCALYQVEQLNAISKIVQGHLRPIFWV